MNFPTHLDHPIAILIRGVPGSGKSYLANELLQSLPSAQVVTLDPDAIDFASQAYKDHEAASRAEGVDEKLLPYRFLRAQAYQAIADHKIIIWNQPFTDQEAFDKIVSRLSEQATACNTTLSVLVVEVTIDTDTAWQRVQERKQAGGHGPSDNTLQRRMQEYSTIADRGYNVVTVQGQQNIADSVSTVMQSLATLV